MKLVTVKEISAHLSVKVSTLYSWVHHGLIPFRKLNGLVRFDMDEIENWVLSSRTEPGRKELPRPKTPPQDVNTIVQKAIDSVKGQAYNRSIGKPGQIKVSGRRFHGTF